MSIWESILLGILQGITEFFPISSSGHLVLAEELLGFKAPDLIAFNVLLHVATLLAVVFYFRRQLINLLFGLIRKDEKQIRLFGALVIGTVPAVFVGLIFSDIVEHSLSNSTSVLIAMFFTACFFIVAEKFQYRHPKKQGVTVSKGLMIGISQALALIPGVSRSGSTLATGLFFKLDREEAAEFSFLLAIPAIAGAGVLTALDLSTPNNTIDIWIYVAGFISSLIFGYLAVSFLMHLYKKHSLYPFAAYLIILSSISLIILHI